MESCECCCKKKNKYTNSTEIKMASSEWRMRLSQFASQQALTDKLLKYGIITKEQHKEIMTGVNYIYEGFE